jgi:hypothetical protein
MSLPLSATRTHDSSVRMVEDLTATEVENNYLEGVIMYNRFIIAYKFMNDRFCGLVVRVPGYRSRGSEFDSRRYQIFWEVVGLERGPLSLVNITEELLERTVAAPV